MRKGTARLLILMLVLSAPVTLANHTLLDNRTNCETYLQDVLGAVPLSELTAEQRKFLASHLLPVTGRRTVEEGTLTIPCGPNCIELSGYGVDEHSPAPKVLRVEWVESGPKDREPHLVNEGNKRILRIPRGFNFSELPRNGQNLMMHFLMGHPLHPYIGSKRAGVERELRGEERFLLKEDQRKAIKAVHGIAERTDAAMTPEERKILVVAPTGFGKTVMLLEALSTRLAAAKNNGKKLQVIMADSKALVNQLAGDIETLQHKGEPFTLIQWGDGYSTDIAALAGLVEQSPVPVVLVTTRQTLVARVDGESAHAKMLRHLKSGSTDRLPIASQNEELLRKNLGMLAYDEAHHSGANDASQLIRALIDHTGSRALLYGTTATPMHHSGGLMDLFGNQSYWTYLDSPEVFLREGGRFDRELDDIVSQLSVAIKRGELTPFHRTFFLDKNELTAGNGQHFFYQRNGNGRGSSYEINPQYYDAVVKKLRPRFRQHKKGFLTVNSIEEAEALTKRLQAEMPDRKFAVLHSELGEETADTIDRARLPSSDPNRIDFLVTVRMLDEGINIPDFSLYIDLNKSLAPRQFMQRVGRVLRLSANKEGVDIVTLMPMDEGSLRENIKVLEAIADNRFKGDHKGEGGQSNGYHPATETGDDVDYQQYVNHIHNMRDDLREQEFWKENGRGARDTAEELVWWYDTFPHDHELPKLKRGPRQMTLELYYARKYLVENGGDVADFDSFTAPLRELLKSSARAGNWLTSGAGIRFIGNIERRFTKAWQYAGKKAEHDMQIEDVLYKRMMRYTKSTASEADHALFLKALENRPELQKMVRDQTQGRVERTQSSALERTVERWKQFVGSGPARLPGTDEDSELRTIILRTYRGDKDAMLKELGKEPKLLAAMQQYLKSQDVGSTKLGSEDLSRWIIAHPTLVKRDYVILVPSKLPPEEKSEGTKLRDLYEQRKLDYVFLSEISPEAHQILMTEKRLLAEPLSAATVIGSYFRKTRARALPENSQNPFDQMLVRVAKQLMSDHRTVYQFVRALGPENARSIGAPDIE
ncbi:MAG: DEAD/DEAH box helicase family protein [Deltaproteobacteria bacterium]|nr:DEAD/DEAH box helicase family protein [Deltaproteobacteria bacterium]